MITRFRDKHAFLSNFYRSPVKAYGVLFPTAEHAFVAAKLQNPNTKQLLGIRNLYSPTDARSYGRHIKLRPDWEQVKVDMMRIILERKFYPDEMCQKLLDTGDQELIEGNYHGDYFWGKCKVGTEWKGRNQLGKLLMEIRERKINSCT